MKKRTQLNISHAVEKYAKEFGAYFDKNVGEWFVDGEVANELEEFVVSTIRLRNYQSEIIPQCPQCGCQMKLITTKQNQFWGCSSYPRCHGLRELDWNSDEDGHVLSYISEKPLPVSEINYPAQLPIELIERKREIGMKAIQILGGSDNAKRWFNRSMVGLNHRKPCDVMENLDGCDAVENLLLKW